MNCFWCPVHLKIIKMEKSSTILAISILVLLSLASQVSRCAASADGIAGVSTVRHRLRPHLQVQEQFHGDMNDHLEMEIQSPSSRKLGPGHEVVGTVELKHHRRITTGHKGGSAGGGAAGGGVGGGAAGAGAGGGGRNVGGGGAVTRPHNSKNGAAALPVPPVASVLALALGWAVALFCQP